MLSTLRAYPLERAVKHMMDHAEFRAGQYGDNLSVVAMRFGEERFEADELMLGDDLGLDGFTTQLKKLSGKEMATRAPPTRNSNGRWPKSRPRSRNTANPEQSLNARTP